MKKEKFKIKVPYIFLDESPTLEAKVLYNKVINIFAKNNIPYIINKNKKLYVITSGRIIRLESLREVIYISSALIILQCRYSNNARQVVDTYLNYGLDILCFPSSILNPNAIFSNNLIRDGAVCITSEYMLLEYLRTFAS